jgi:hypothetical protein
MRTRAVPRSDECCVGARSGNAKDEDCNCAVSHIQCARVGMLGRIGCDATAIATTMKRSDGRCPSGAE